MKSTWLNFCFFGWLLVATWTADAASLKSNHCVQWIKLNLNQEEPLRLSRMTPMWRGFYENLRLLGYPDKVIAVKRNELVEGWPETSALAVRGVTAYQPVKYVYQTLANTYQEAGGSTPTNRVWYPIMGLTSQQLSLVELRTSSVLEYLGYWSNVRGFDATNFVQNFLLKPGPIGSNDLKNLMYWSHVWTTELQDPASTILRLFSKVNSDHDLVPYSWLKHAFDLPEKQLNRLYIDYLTEISNNIPRQELPVFLLKVLANLPLDTIPKSIKEHLKDWIDLAKYPALKLETVQFCQNGYKETGTCEYMTNGHLSSLGIFEASRDERKNILLMIDGVIVGSLKLTGEPSMIALRNVMDSDGRLVLALGGVYHLNYDIAVTLESLRFRKGRWWKGAKLSELYLHPSTFLMNENAWESTNFVSLLKSTRDQFPKDELIDILFAYSDDQFIDGKKKPVLTATAWPILLQRLDEVRQKFEISQKSK